MKGIIMTTTPDAWELRASELYDEQMKRYVHSRKEASAFLAEPFEKSIFEKIKLLCEMSKTATYGDYEF
jgi:hypothetical protein